MNYAQGSFGRVFLVKFEDKDDLLEGLKEVAIREHIHVATVMLPGGMRSAGLVTGPRQPVIPPDPVWMHFTDCREVMAIGTLFRKGNEPVLHLHGSIGRDRETVAGCIRKEAAAYLVIEAVITEIVGTDARKVMNEQTGAAMLEL